MGIRIFFLFSFGICVFLSMFIEVSNTKKDLIIQLVTRAFFTICFGVTMAFVINIVSIPIDLFSMAFAYIGYAIFVSLYLIKKRRVQKYYVSLSTIIGFGISFLLWIIIFYIVFGKSICLAYGNCDAGSHYGLALEIFKTHKLNRMYFSSLFNCFCMELLQPFLSYGALYKAFILGDAVLNLFHIWIFYILISNYCKTKYSYVSQIILTCIYFIGWPVYSWVYGGFVYYGVGVTVFMLGLYTIINMWEEKWKYYGHIIMCVQVVVIFCLIESYILFVPIYILAVLGVILYKSKHLITKKRMIIGCLLACLGLLGAFLLIFYGYFGGSFSFLFKALRTNGGVHRELYKDFLFLLPINAYLLYVKYKNKNIDVLVFFQLSLFSVVLLALGMNLSGWMSDYYYYKFYFLIWMILFVGVAQALDYFWSTQREIIYFVIAPLLVVVVVELSGVANLVIPCDTGSQDIFPILTKSVKWVENGNDNQQQLNNLIDVCVYVNEYLSDSNDVPYLGFGEWNSVTWYRSITGKSDYGFEVFPDEESLNSMIAEFAERDVNYMTVLQDIEGYWKNMKFFQQFERVYNNNYYGVYKIN